MLTPSSTEPFVRLSRPLLRSSAWQSLPPVARALYVEIADKYTGWNNGNIPFSIREAKQALHVGQSTIYRALNVLRDRGLIICHIVCDNRGVIRLWELTDYNWDNAGADREFLHWEERK
jgi:DNA-binding transcriptional ArsR family regulator